MVTLAHELKGEQNMITETPQSRYEARNIVRFTLKVNKNTDADILAKLESVENKQGYLKALIRADIAKEARRERRKQLTKVTESV